MRRATAVPAVARLTVGRREVGAVWRRVLGRGGLVAALMTLSLVCLGEGAPGGLDLMSGGGAVITDFGGGEVAFALVLQPDGKLVTAGQFNTGDSTGIGLARYLPDGRLDPTFGDGGTVTTDFGGFDAASALVLQPDGKLVAAGGFSPDGFHPGDFALARYLLDGRLDPTFGVGGMVTTDFGGFEEAFALVLQADGKLVAAGLSIADIAPSGDFALARYLLDGRLDPTFGVGGMVTTDFGNFDVARALVLQPDGKLVAAGEVGFVLTASGDFGLARYLPDGRLDPSFGDGGTVTTDVGGTFEAGAALVLQPDGKLVAAGSVVDSTGFSFDFALVRYLPDGTLDGSFGVGGTVTTDFSGGGAFAFALVLQSDGKLVAAGGFSPQNAFPDDIALARYLPDGQLDPTFGTGVEINVNALVTFEPIASTFAFTPDPSGCPAGFVGTFNFEARLTNSSESALTDLVVAATTLTNGNLLQNADGGPGGVGARLTVPQQSGFSDGMLSPEEFVDVPFIICLTERRPFTFTVDVFGVVDANADTQAGAQPVQERRVRAAAGRHE